MLVKVYVTPIVIAGGNIIAHTIGMIPLANSEIERGVLFIATPRNVS